jgi:hypothetical protein
VGAAVGDAGEVGLGGVVGVGVGGGVGDGATAPLAEGAGGVDAALLGDGAAVGVAGEAEALDAVELSFFAGTRRGAVGSDPSSDVGAGLPGGEPPVVTGEAESAGANGLGSAVAPSSSVRPERRYQAAAPPARRSPAKPSTASRASAPRDEPPPDGRAGCEVANTGAGPGWVLGIVVANEPGPET